MATDYPAVLKYAKRLIILDWFVAFVGAYCGVAVYFWYATLQCGPR